MHDTTNLEYNAGPINGPRIPVKAKDVIPMVTDRNYMTCFMIWSMFHKGLGLPFGGGWADQPTWMVKIISDFEDEFNAEENYKSKTALDKSKTKSASGASGASSGSGTSEKLFS